MPPPQLVAIISEAASSGISLQADRRVPNQRKRVHMTLELPWSADQCIQQCGRSHRSNQVCGPEYILIMTACGGERRFASTVAKRLQQLGALTKADRRAADASDLSAFDVDTKYGLKAMRESVEMLKNAQYSAQHPPKAHIRDALGLKANAELQERWTAYLEAGEDAVFGCGIDPDKDVKSFLNRLLGVPVHLQNMIFTHFSAELDEQVKTAKANDKFDEGVVDIRGEAITLKPGFPQTLANDGLSGVPLLHHVLEVDRGVSFDRATELLDEKAKGNPEGKLFRAEGFYRSKRPTIGREADGMRATAVLIQKPTKAFTLNALATYKLYRPASGLGKDVALEDFCLGARYEKVDPELANKEWTRAYKEALTTCSHGPNCKNRSFCKIGLRRNDVHLVTGSVLPFWAHLQEAVGYYTTQTARATTRHSRMAIVRVRFTGADGKEQRLVGINVRTEQEMRRLQASLGGAPGSSSGAASSSTDAKPEVKPDIKPPIKIYTKLASVMIHQLKSQGALKFNYNAAIVEEWVAEAGRYRVRVVKGANAGQTLLCRPENLMSRK